MKKLLILFLSIIVFNIPICVCASEIDNSNAITDSSESADTKEPDITAHFTSEGYLFEIKFHGNVKAVRGGFILNYNPEVFKVGAYLVDYDNLTFEEIGYGKYKVTFRLRSNGQTSYIRDPIGFSVVGPGTPNLSVESFYLEDVDGIIHEDALIIEEYDNQEYHTVPWEFDATKQLLYIKDNLNYGDEFPRWTDDSIKTIVFNEGVEVIEDHIFDEHRNLKHIYIPDSIKYISPFIFVNNYNNVVLHGSSKSLVEEYAYQYGHGFVPTNEQLLGDVDGNGKYEATDALDILRMVVQLDTMYGYTGDADGNGEVTGEDALLVLQKVVKLVE